MRAGKPHRVFLWLARFFGVMVVMGVYEAFRREGIQLGGLIVWGAGIGAWILVPWIIRELGARKKAEHGSTQSLVTEVPKEEGVPVQQEDGENKTELYTLVLLPPSYVVGRGIKKAPFKKRSLLSTIYLISI